MKLTNEAYALMRSLIILRDAQQNNPMAWMRLARIKDRAHDRYLRRLENNV
jgi:hypothetical protein